MQSRDLVPVIVTPATDAAIAALCDLDRLKRHAILETDEDSALAIEFAQTAFDWLQPPGGCLRPSIAPQTLRIDLPCWPFAMIELPFGPVTEIESLKYFDEANAEQTVSASEYFLDGDVLIFNETWSAPSLYTRPGAVRIEYTAGLTPERVPRTIKTAIAQCVAHWLENREAVSSVGALQMMPLGVEDLIFSQRFR